MVKYEYIIKVIEDYTVKCPTIAEMKQKLSRMSDTEKLEALTERGLINEFEREHYEKMLDMMQWWVREGFKNAPKLVAHYKELQFSKYDRRLFDGYKPKESQVVDYDESEYVKEKETSWDDPMFGEYEKIEIANQEDIIFTEGEKNAVRHYLNSGYEMMNSKINKGEKWQSLDDDEKRAYNKKFKEMDDNLSSAISKSKGLVNPTVMFHGGFFDVSYTVGDTIKFNGFTSCSFQESVARNYQNNKSKDLMGSCMYKILLPKGYKGLLGNARYFTKDSNKNEYNYVTVYQKEHEYLLPKNAEFKVANVEKITKTWGYSYNMVTLIPV